MTMTVGRLIEILKTMPQDKEVNIDSQDMDCGRAVSVKEYLEVVSIESKSKLYREG